MLFPCPLYSAMVFQQDGEDTLLKVNLREKLMYVQQLLLFSNYRHV